MMFYQTVTLLNAPEHDRFLVHNRLDIHLRKTFLGIGKQSHLTDIPDFLPAYAFHVSPQTEDKSVMMIRSAVPFSLAGEKLSDIAFAQGDEIDVSVLLSAHSKTTERDSQKALDSTYIGSHIANRLALCGFEPVGEVMTLLKGKPRRYFMKKTKQQQRNKPFSLYAYALKGKVKVIDPELALKGFIEGIGNKRAFGFGLMMLVERR